EELQDIARLSDRFISVAVGREPLRLEREAAPGGQDLPVLPTVHAAHFTSDTSLLRRLHAVASPRLENGYVLDGGAICMELLRSSSAQTLSVGNRAKAGNGRICRKAGKSKKSFSRKEAEATFKSLVKTHEKYGWVTPPVSDG
uniref:Ubiquitin conjugating enzyme E2 QL1 n=1 Tax=Microcebus murinus TaxID=30608 RepID=A0A8C5Y4A3_MICMU